jgi:hypothetical protein
MLVLELTQKLIEYIKREEKYIDAWYVVERGKREKTRLWWMNKYYVIICKPPGIKKEVPYTVQILTIHIPYREYTQAIIGQMVEFNSSLFEKINLVTKEFNPESVRYYREMCQTVPNFAESEKRFADDIIAIFKKRGVIPDTEPTLH